MFFQAAPPVPHGSLQQSAALTYHMDLQLRMVSEEACRSTNQTVTTRTCEIESTKSQACLPSSCSTSVSLSIGSDDADSEAVR